MFYSIVIFIVFIAFAIAIQKFQKKSLANYSAAAQASDPFKSLAEQLGLHYEVFTPEANKKTLYSSGSIMTGTYKNIPVEVVYAMSTQSAPTLSQYVASYTMQKTVTFTVDNTQKKEFQILPKSLVSNGGKATGNSRFDALFCLIGDIALPSTLLEYCAELGWMNLSLKGNTLIFSDTFYDEIAGLQMINTAHPIWKSTPRNTAIDMPSAKRFFDEMTSFVSKL